ncbi:thioredoxin domain-containing protein [Paenibacillus apiarius]|uniref:thioredoxin domain-containing protein n=1 Tax=Paenibacillus apiarius TaxID=46240 RepID=UPI00197CEFE3|nr:thioredoxin domain-containing protein [Paenibacillus apiarius]MBN3526827.1 thioredoxin domain-containing protein [Paenibacillus apiarius]
MTTNHKPNRLIDEKSPYLLQHAYNPVNWYAWSDEAFDEASKENKPIFLSIGYSTCHWCHVMEKESFEDEEVAQLLNEHYISIKVDREERPDVDHLYMSVCQAMTGQGGWPLTVILTPEKTPFFAGTYFPKQAKYGRIGLMELLGKLADKWAHDRDELHKVGEQIRQALGKRSEAESEGQAAGVDEEALHVAFGQFEEDYDETYGGFNSAPKFPSPHNLSWLLAYGSAYGDPVAAEMALHTLRMMARGGIYDHIGFGFARYSTDQSWLVPHFEKMLYDNALLAMAYIDAYQATGDKPYSDIAESVLAYVLRDMTAEEGGFYSAEDADSEGVEGKFYVWKPQEVMELLGSEAGKRYCELYDITEGGNFEGDSIPNLLEWTVEEYANKHGLDSEEFGAELHRSRERLFQAREGRVHPHKDDKILTSWNGLMIAALARAAKALQQPRYAAAAERAASFILDKLRRTEDGRLLARYRDGEAAFLAYADDYAFLIWGLTELYEATAKPDYLDHAVSLQKRMIDLFWDDDDGGFYFYGSDGEQLLTRMKEIYDGAIPSGNAVAAVQLQKLALMTEDDELRSVAERQLQAFAGTVKRYPSGYAMTLLAWLQAVRGQRKVVIEGDPDHALTKEMIAAVQRAYAPDAAIVFKLDKKLEPAAYVCADYACQAPVHDAESLLEQLKST